MTITTRIVSIRVPRRVVNPSIRAVRYSGTRRGDRPEEAANSAVVSNVMRSLHKSLIEQVPVLRSLLMSETMTVKVVQKIAQVPRADWDALVGNATPFLKWDWLDSLEQSGCVNERSGWLPHHVIVENGGR